MKRHNEEMSNVNGRHKHEVCRIKFVTSTTWIFVPIMRQ